MKEQLNEAVNFLKSKGLEQPDVGIVLGTGLGKLVDEIEIALEIPYAEIPNFPVATVEFHSGKLIFGFLSGKKVIVMNGRFHLYEGYSLWEVTFGIRVLRQLGISKLLISNASGSVNPNFKKGDLMLIDDHINLQGNSPLAFSNVKEFGSQFTDMIEPYSKTLNKTLLDIAKANNIILHKGVYAGVFGPQLETRAEYRMLKIIGADVVGMSTVPEIIVAQHLGLEAAAISVITDDCDPDNLQPINIPEIIEIAGKAEPKMIILFKDLLKQI